MKASQIIKLAEQTIPAGERILLVGPPGVGKTAVMQQAAEAAKADFLALHPVVSDPTDFKGLPAVVDAAEGKSAEFLPYGDLWKMIKAPRRLAVSFEDLGTATNATQAAVMQVIWGGYVGLHKISDLVTFNATTNRRQDRAGVTGLITPLLDRFTTVLTMDFDLDDWSKWAIQNNMPPFLIAFNRFRPDLIGSFDVNSGRDMKKSPTPRSVAGIGRLFNRGIFDHEIIAGAVGEAYAAEVLGFYKTWSRIPDINEIYLNPNFAPLPEEPDVLFALMAALAHHANESNIEQTVTYLRRLGKPEYGVACIKDAIVKAPEIKRSNAFNKWIMENREALGYDK